MNTSFNPLETQLAAVWQQLLAQQPNHDSHFFAMGGNSLLLIRLSIGISEQMGLSVDVSGLLQNPRFADMAQHIAAKVVTQLPKYDGRHSFSTTSVPLTFAQKAVWQSIQTGAGSANHNLPLGLHILSQIDVARLQQAVAMMMVRHRILRAQVVLNEQGEPMLMPNAATIELNTLDLSLLAEVARSERLHALEHDLFATALPVLNSPLAILQWVKLADDEHYLYLNLHHIVFDGVSCDVFVNELMSLYAQKSLPPLVVDYFDYAQWEASAAYRASLQSGVGYWQERLAAHQPAVLPLLNPDSADAAGAFLSQTLPIRVLQGLRALAQRHDTTLFVVFALALQVVLERHKKQGDVAFGTYTSQRLYAEFTQTLGNFINPTVVCRDWREDQTVAQALSTQQQQIAQDFAWQHIPHEAIERALAADRAGAPAALFDVSLVFNEQVLQKEHRQGDLHIKLESHAEHRIDFAFDTDIEFMAHTNAEGLFVAAAYKKHKVGEAFIHKVMDELFALLTRLPDINPTTVMTQLIQHES
ncbi:MAG: hypothetical protein KBC57_01610 [Neisseriaceae bacterium]|nr:hypothetical protein [Neisseriaceae bacterium]